MNAYVMELGTQLNLVRTLKFRHIHSMSMQNKYTNRLKID